MEDQKWCYSKRCMQLIMWVGDYALDSTYSNKSGSLTGMSSGSAGFAFSSTN